MRVAVTYGGFGRGSVVAYFGCTTATGELIFGLHALIIMALVGRILPQVREHAGFRARPTSNLVERTGDRPDRRHDPTGAGAGAGARAGV